MTRSSLLRNFCLAFVLLGFFQQCKQADQPAIVEAEELQLSLPPKLQDKIPFDLGALAKAPTFRWENQEDSVWSLFYEGGEFSGNPTEVFAYYASPATLQGKSEAGKKYPAMVLMHGGGGTAFAVWAREWAEKGYAAISMDLSGAKPWPESEQSSPWATKSDSLPNGAPDDTHIYKFFKLDEGFTEQWQFHAVSNAIRAHSLIRSFADTDTTKTALTGISWGGYLTNIISGIDHRFQATVPIYGCGFLHEQSAWLRRFDSLGVEKTKEWVELWDPSQYVSHVTKPMLFVNGTNDFAYPVESWQKTTALAPDANRLMIVEMVHNHSKGAAPDEIQAFIVSVIYDKPPLLTFSSVKKIENMLQVTIDGTPKVKEAQLVFTEDEGKNKERKWQTQVLALEGNALSAKIPTNAKLAYFLVTDERGMRSSSEVVLAL